MSAARDHYLIYPIIFPRAFIMYIAQKQSHKNCSHGHWILQYPLMSNAFWCVLFLTLINQSNRFATDLSCRSLLLVVMLSSESLLTLFYFLQEHSINSLKCFHRTTIRLSILQLNYLNFSECLHYFELTVMSCLPH